MKEKNEKNKLKVKNEDRNIILDSSNKDPSKFANKRTKK